ncbi:MAG: outer membrane beta-barrel domain-containing protein [Gammaproteobacteria bacterium]|jgi:outer membrane beta-barrel protein
MDNWFKRLFLVRLQRHALAVAIGGALSVLSLCWAGPVVSAENATAGESGGDTGPVQVITPEVQPQKIREADIDDESFEVGIYAGVLTIDNFGSNPVYGINASYYATEDLFLQLNYAVSEADKTSWEDLSGFNLLTDSDRDYTYYNALVGYNIFPGEVFMTSKLTFNAAFYLVGGVGNTEFGGEDNFTTTLGAGYRIVLRDWLTWHIDFRDHIFKSDVLNAGETTNNIELSTGMTVFF